MAEMAGRVLVPDRCPLTIGNFTRMVWDLFPMILVHVGALAIVFTGGTLLDWGLFLVVLYLRGICVTVGYHRYFAHRSFKTSRLVQFLLAVGCCATLQQGPLWWALHHRLHHRHSDQPDDPHSPHRGGFLWAYCGWLFVPLRPDWRGVSDLRRFPELVWLERFWQLPGLLFAGLCYWVGGWSMVCVTFCLSAVVTFNMSFIVNTATHLMGTRRYETRDQSRNSPLIATLTLGEGWHNNHHHYPNTAQAGFFPGEQDAAFDFICLMERLGIFWDVRRVPEHKLHPPTAGVQESSDSADPVEDEPLMRVG